MRRCGEESASAGSWGRSVIGQRPDATGRTTVPYSKSNYGSRGGGIECFRRRRRSKVTSHFADCGGEAFQVGGSWNLKTAKVGSECRTQTETRPFNCTKLSKFWLGRGEVSDRCGGLAWFARTQSREERDREVVPPPRTASQPLGLHQAPAARCRRGSASAVDARGSRNPTA